MPKTPSQTVYVIYDDTGEFGLIIRHATNSEKHRDKFCLKWGCKWKEVIFYNDLFRRFRKASKKEGQFK